MESHKSKLTTVTSASLSGPVMATVGATEILQEIKRSMTEFRAQLQQLSVKMSGLEQLYNVTNSGSSTTVPGTDQVVRLDGRIDLLDGKFNLIKHELKQLYLLNNQQQLSAVNTTWDLDSRLEQGMGAPSSFEQDIDVFSAKIKTEPEILLEYEDESDLLLPDDLELDDNVENDPDFKIRGSSDKKKRKLAAKDMDEAGEIKTIDAIKSLKPNENGKFACPSCGIEVVNKNDLTRHYNKHIGKNKYPCQECGTVFNRKDNWMAHMKKKHLSDASVSPPTRTSVLKLTKGMLDSIQLNPHTSKYPCPFTICTEEFDKKEDIVQHYQMHITPRPYPCKYCSARFSIEQKLAQHVRWRHAAAVEKKIVKSSPRLWIPKGEKQCPICMRIFSRREHAIRHIKTHSIALQDNFPCEECDKIYTRRDKLLVHQREKHPKATDSTDASEKVTEVDGAESQNTNEALETSGDTTEKKPQPPPQQQLHSCPECGKSFGQKCKVERHVIGCRGLKPFSCAECGKCFTQNAALIQHRAYKHQGIKRFLCSECGSCFYGSTNYKKHVRTHTGVKPYPCSICGRHFNGRSDLKRHEKIHSGVRDFPCTQCDLKFHRRDALLKHTLVHTGEKPWMCDLCGASFSQSGSMKKHRESCSLRLGEGKSVVVARKPRTQHKTPRPAPAPSRFLNTQQHESADQGSMPALHNQAMAFNTSSIIPPYPSSNLQITSTSSTLTGQTGPPPSAFDPRFSSGFC